MLLWEPLLAQRRCCVTSPGSRVGITGLFAAGSAMLRLWHGLGLFRWLVSVGVKARVQRTGFQVVLESDRREKQEQEQESKRGRNAGAPRLLNCPILDPAHRRLVKSECPYGAEPRPCP